ncbi:MAG: PIN domain-containing protein [Eubacteriales bacterium]|nr:PIN domain-containing protein [Eubacteriales bacterium]
MRASLDTNIIIHFYRANLQNILFESFEDGVFIYEQIRIIELENHAKELLKIIDADIDAGRIGLYTDDKMKQQSVFEMFQKNVSENRMLYGSGDLGEVYAISLAQTLGAYSLLTDDTKQGGPYMSLLQFEDDIMPFTFADVLLLRYLIGMVDEFQTVQDFNTINTASSLNWSFRSQVSKFVKRFWRDPYRKEDHEWIQKLVDKYNIRVKSKLSALSKLI